MQKKIQIKMRKVKKSINQFIKRLIFFGKMSIILLMVFFAVLFMLTKPIRTNIEKLFTMPEQTTMVGTVSKDEFLEIITPIAKQVQVDYGIRPSVLVAQAALESNWGNSDLSQQSNNYFGIKGNNSGKQYATKEFDKEKWQSVQASFRTYDSVGESVMDYAKLIKNGTSWNSDLYLDVINAEHYKDAAQALQKAGYATDPDYANKLIRIIEQYALYELDV